MFACVLAHAFGEGVVSVERVTLQDMVHRHVDRVMRKTGILCPTRHGEPSTNWFGRVIVEGEDSLTEGFRYLQLRDEDGSLEIRDSNGLLEKTVLPVRSDAAFMLGDLFGFVPDETTPPELRLSHLVSKWLVVGSEESSARFAPMPEELAAFVSMRPSLARLADAPY